MKKNNFLNFVERDTIEHEDLEISFYIMTNTIFMIIKIHYSYFHAFDMNYKAKVLELRNVLA